MPKKVNLQNTQLSSDQVNILCDTIVDQEKMVLEEIDLGANNLAMVDKLARAVVRVKIVHLPSTGLTVDQLTAICHRIKGENHLALKRLGLEGNRKLRGFNKTLLDEIMVEKVVQITVG